MMRDAGDRAVIDESARSRARRRLAAWLHDGPAQIRSGEHAGALAGSVAADGTPLYLYPEIGGYFLQWLAWRATQGDARDELASRARAAQAWLARWAPDARAPTRVHLAPMTDWRNDATFTFDLAMVLRGVASAARADLIAADATLVARVDARLSRAIGDDGMLDACERHAHSPALPRTWSTQRGPFLAKAAAGVLAASRVCELAGPLCVASAVTLEALLDETLQAPHAELHPALYAIEGAIALRDTDVLAALAPQLGRCFEAIAAAGAHGADRLDVRAQALRAGCAFRALGVKGAPSRALLCQLADPLIDAVRTDGGLPFAPRDRAASVWTAMFADQALAWLDGDVDCAWLV